MPTPSLPDVQTFAQVPNVLTPDPEPRRYMLSLSVNANCLTPPSTVNPCPPGLKVTICVFDPPSLSAAALLNIVLETIPVTNVFGAGDEVGLLVPLITRIVFADRPEILML